MFEGKLLQVLIGNFILFFAMALVVELCLFGFKIQNPRMRAICRFLPFLKLTLGMVVCGIVSLNFFSCQSVFSIKTPPEAFILFILVTAVLILRRGYQCIVLLLYLRKACILAKRSLRPIFNHKLKKTLKDKHINLLVSDVFSIPVAIGRKTILIPEKLMTTFSQEEYESVVAHELDHLVWKDPYVKFLCLVICELFWWIPTKWWVSRLEEEQEYACDRGIERFGMEGAFLASALMKVIKQEKQDPLLCGFTAKRHQALKRVEKMLQFQEQSGPVFLGLIVLASLFILMGYHIC